MLPLPVAEEGSESARQAPVFYEGDSPDGKYAGANEKCRFCRQATKFRAPQESIRETVGFIRTSGVSSAAVSLGTVLSAIADLTGYGRRDIIGPEKRVHDLYLGVNICYT